MRSWFLFLTALTGCVAAPAATPTFTTPVCACEPAFTNPGRAEQPVLAVGTAWSYEGTLLYQGEVAFTVIVAEAGSEGYLFAGATRDDIAFSATWGSKWFGAKQGDLNTPERQWFTWPLEDEKTWEYRDGLTVRARATENGFDIQGADDAHAVRYHYSTAIQTITSYEIKLRGEVEEEVQLVKTGHASTATWYETPAPVYVDDATTPTTFDVPTGIDNVIVSAGGANGGFAAVAPPGAPAWTAHFPDAGGAEGSWQLVVLPGTQGKWAASVTGGGLPLTTWSVAMISPVKWRELSLAPTS